jgi:hypothetical protein
MVSQSLREAVHEPKKRKFLKDLYNLDIYEGKKRAKLINSVGKGEIAVLLQILRLLVNGDIPIRADHFRRIKQAKKLGFLRRHFEEADNFKRLNSSSILEQKKVLRCINTYHQLLFFLFNLPESKNV